METRRVKRKRLNIARTLVLILVLYILVCTGIYIYKMPIKHFEISGNKYISDTDIIRYLKLEDYPSFISLNPKKAAKTLEKNSFVKSAKVKYGWNFKIIIEIEENRPILFDKYKNGVRLSDGTLVEMEDDGLNVPTLLNNTPENVLKVLTSKLDLVDDGILFLISEIEYKPTNSISNNNNIIDGNFLLSMSDGNLVYITARKADLLNKYLKTIATDYITNNGTLYLDIDEVGFLFDMFPGSTLPEKPKQEDDEDFDDILNDNQGGDEGNEGTR